MGKVKPFKKPFNPSPTKARLFLGVALAQQQNKALAEAFDKEMVDVRKQVEDLTVNLARVIVRAMVTEQLLKERLGLTKEEIDQAVQAVAPMPISSDSSEGEAASAPDSNTETCNLTPDSVSEQSQESEATTCVHSEGNATAQSSFSSDAPME